MTIGAGGRVHAASLLVLSACAFIAGCSGSPGAEQTTATAAPTSTPVDGEIQMAAVGDSITVADSEDFPHGELGEGSWVKYAVGDGVALVGGWGAWGATTAEMAAAVEPVDADVQVVLAGTNDISTGVPFDETAANIATIVETVGAPEVLLVSVPPLDARPDEAVRLNADLEALAQAREWGFVDAADQVRDDGRFAEGMSDDGVHPTAAGAEKIGTAIREALVEHAPEAPSTAG